MQGANQTKQRATFTSEGFLLLLSLSKRGATDTWVKIEFVSRAETLHVNQSIKQPIPPRRELPGA
jgi:hypothetical protein